MRKIIYFSALLSVFFVWPFLGQAQDDGVFEEESEAAVRTSYELYGGYPEDFAISSDGVLYAALNSPNGIFVSQDDGATWDSPAAGSDFGTVGDVETSGEYDNIAFMLGGISLYRTQDYGASWEELAGATGDTRDNNYGSVMLYAHGKLLVAGRDGSLDVSDDDGDSFTNVVVDSDIGTFWSLAASPTEDVFYLIGAIGETDYLYQSTDAGATWEATGISGDYIEIEVKPTDADFMLLRGGTGGVTYSINGLTGPWTAFDLEEVNDMAFAGDRIFVGRYWTDDDGTTWQTAVGFDSILKGNHVLVDPNNTDIVYTTSGLGIARTTNGGLDWTDIVEGLLGVTVNNITQAEDNKDIVWLAAHGGLAKTENFQDATPTWEYPILPSEAVDYADAVWLDPDNPDTVVVGAGSIYRSTDGGDTWLQTSDQSMAGAVKSIVANSDASILYAGAKEDDGTGSVWMSEDEGQTWTDLGAPDLAVNVLTMTSSDLLLAGVGTENITDTEMRGIYSYDGSIWTQLTGDIEGYLINDLLVVGDTIYAAGGETDQGSVFRSTDDGATWEDLEANGLPADGWFHALTYESTNPDVVYVSTARPAGTGHIYKSMDAGDSWSEYYTGLKDETFNSMLFDGLALGTNVGLYSLQSKVKLTLTADKEKIKKGKKVVLTATLKDAATNQGLSKKVVKLFYRTKKNGDWIFLAKAKTKKNGKITFTHQLKKDTFYQIRWKPKNEADLAGYGETVKKSKQLRIKVKD